MASISLTDVLNTANNIREALNRVQAFGDECRNLQLRVDLFTALLQGRETQLQSAAQVSLRTCINDCQTFVLNVAVSSTLMQFANNTKYYDKFESLNKRLDRCRDDIQLVLNNVYPLSVVQFNASKIESPAVTTVAFEPPDINALIQNIMQSKNNMPEFIQKIKLLRTNDAWKWDESAIMSFLLGIFFENLQSPTVSSAVCELLEHAPVTTTHVRVAHFHRIISEDINQNHEMRIRLLYVLLTRVNSIQISGNALINYPINTLREVITQGNLPSITSLHLSDHNIGDNGAASLATVITTGNLSGLKSLCLDNIGMSDAGFGQLARALQTSVRNRTVTLTYLHLPRNQVGETGANALAKMLSDGSCLSSLTSLDLKENPTPDISCRSIIRACKGKNSLTSLSLLSNVGCDHALEGLSKSIERNELPNLHSLYLSCSKFSTKYPRWSGPDCRKSFIKAFQSIHFEFQFQFMTSLTLAGLRLGDQVITKFIQTVFSQGKMQALTSLDLSDNMMTEVSAKALAEPRTLRWIPELQNLHLQHNHINDVGARFLVDTIAGRTDGLLSKFTAVNISFNPLTNDCVRELRSKNFVILDKHVWEWDHVSGPLEIDSNSPFRVVMKWNHNNPQRCQSKRTYDNGIVRADFRIVNNPVSDGTTGRSQFIFGAAPVDFSNSFLGHGISYGYAASGEKVNNSLYQSYGSAFGINRDRIDTIGVQLNFISGDIIFFLNGESQNIAFQGISCPLRFCASLAIEGTAFELVDVLP